MKTIIIMCDGLGSRWIDNKVKYKHLIEFDGIPLVFRTIKQLQHYSCKIILIAPDEFKNYNHYPENILHTTLGYRETQPRTLIDGIIRTKPFWSENTTILLGDVCFSKKAIDLLFTEDHSEWILGRMFSNPITGKVSPELFALSFTEDIIDKVKFTFSGKLWNYAYIYTPTLINPKDYTDDFDSPQAYEQFYDKMLEAVRRDDE